MKKILSLFLFLFLSYYSYAQTIEIPKKQTQKAFAKLDFLSIKMPETSIPNEKNMGFSGIHYNLGLD